MTARSALLTFMLVACAPLARVQAAPGAVRSPFQAPVSKEVASFLKHHFPSASGLSVENEYLRRAFAPWAAHLPKSAAVAPAADGSYPELNNRSTVEELASKAVKDWIDFMDEEVSRAVASSDMGALERLSREMEDGNRFVAAFVDKAAVLGKLQRARASAAATLPLAVLERVSRDAEYLSAGKTHPDVQAQAHLVAWSETLRYPESVEERDRVMAELVKLVKQAPDHRPTADAVSNVFLLEFERLDTDADAPYGEKLLKHLRRIAGRAADKELAGVIASRILKDYSILHPRALAEKAALTAAAIAIGSGHRSALAQTKLALIAKSAGETTGPEGPPVPTIPSDILDKATRRVDKALNRLNGVPDSKRDTEAVIILSALMSLFGMVAAGYVSALNPVIFAMALTGFALALSSLRHGRYLTVLFYASVLSAIAVSVPLTGMSWSISASLYFVAAVVAVSIAGMYHLLSEKTKLSNLIMTFLALMVAGTFFMLAFAADRVEKTISPVKDKVMEHIMPPRQPAKPHGDRSGSKADSPPRTRREAYFRAPSKPDPVRTVINKPVRPVQIPAGSINTRIINNRHSGGPRSTYR